MSFRSLAFCDRDPRGLFGVSSCQAVTAQHRALARGRNAEEDGGGRISCFARKRRLFPARGRNPKPAIAGRRALAENAALKRPPVAPLANDTGRAETAGTSADISSMSPTGVSAATPVAPEVDAQAVEGLASKASPQMTDPEPARSVSLRADGTQIAGEPGSAAVKPASGPVNGADGTARPSFILPAKRPEAAIPSAAADTPSAPLPIGTPERHALQRMVESVVASATPAEAPAAGSTGWVVQLGAASSEAEAKRDLKRLKTKYGSALRGSSVGLRKVLVNGETVYRLHVVGLSRDEAAALCSRVKGDGGSCSIVR